jgi:hypothetical protein
VEGDVGERKFSRSSDCDLERSSRRQRPCFDYRHNRNCEAGALNEDNTKVGAVKLLHPGILFTVKYTGNKSCVHIC